jgi:glycosyltransferase involved in cell wall biosynthesis
MANALRRLADDPVARRQMGARAAAFARERYGWDSIAPVMSRLYAGLL